MRVHAAVPDVVWCPANIMEMNMPVTTSALKRGLPSGSRTLMSTSSRSRSASAGRLLCRSAVHDLADELDELQAGLVSSPEALDRRIRVHIGDGVGAPLQVVVKLREPAVELVAEPLADQACRRRVDRELGEPVEKVDRARVAPARRPSVRPLPRSSQRGRA